MKKKINIVFLIISISFLSGQSLLSQDNQTVSVQDSIDEQQLEFQLNDKINGEIDDTFIEEKDIEIDLNQEKIEYFKENKLFGYSYFIKNINFYDNIPTPNNYKLGPGDEVVISFWGEQNSRESLLINKDGLIFYENIGFINLTNLTLAQAEEVLKKKFAEIYATLNNSQNPTYLKIELKNLKSVNVYFTGNVINPGVTLIHPFSDVFSAIIQSGGIDENGSLRNIQVIRNQKVVATIDFYSFFMDGKNNFSEIRILDGDIIHIPSISNRIEVKGAVQSEGFFEILPGESVASAVKFANGFSKDASQSAIIEKIVPFNERQSDDYAKTSINLLAADFDNMELNNGDSVEILNIPEVDSKVFVYGRVKSPGEYSFASSLRKVLDLAGGFDDPYFRKTILADEIIISRKDDTNFYPITLVTSYKDSNSFQLQPGDKIFIYENINYKNNPTFQVEGEVNRPGIYPYTKGITLGSALQLAGGLTEFANRSDINVLLQFSEFDEFGNETVFNEPVSNLSNDFQLGINSKIVVLNTEKVVRVVGHVYNPGLIAIEQNSVRLKKIIELAGGYKENAIKRDVYIKRANSKIDKIGFFRGAFLRVNKGDTLIVPEDINPQDFEVTQFISDLSSTLANIAAILIVIERSKD